MHMYSDVSHFRAPYKNISVQGFGAVTNGGAPPPPGTTCPTTPQGVDTVSAVGPDGVRRYTPAEADRLLSSLHSWRYVFLTNTNVKVEPISPEEQAAAQQDPAYAATLYAHRATDWISKKVSEGYAIYAPFIILCPTAEVLSSSVGIQLGATPASNVAAMKAASEAPSPEMPIGAYLTGPSADVQPGVAKAQITPALWAFGIIAAVGAGAYLLSRESRPKVGRSQIPASLRA